MGLLVKQIDECNVHPCDSEVRAVNKVMIVYLPRKLQNITERKGKDKETEDGEREGGRAGI